MLRVVHYFYIPLCPCFTGNILGKKLREEFIKLLEEDIEFRYIVMSFLGIREILERIDKNTEAIRDLQEQVRVLQKQMSEHTKAIRSLQEQVLENTKAIRVLQGQVVENTRAIRGLQEQVLENTKAIRSLQEQVAENTRTIRGLQEQVRSLQEQVLENTKAIRSLQEQVLENTKAIKSLQGQTLELTKELKRLGDRISALGARWGLIAEEVFRESLRKFLQDYFKVARVERWEHYDEEGFVYGYPSVVEVDLIIKDEVHYLIEVKSSTSKSDISELYRIGILYEKKTGVKPQLTAVTCFIEERARKVAEKLGIKVITY